MHVAALREMPHGKAILPLLIPMDEDLAEPWSEVTGTVCPGRGVLGIWTSEGLSACACFGGIEIWRWTYFCCYQGLEKIPCPHIHQVAQSLLGLLVLAEMCDWCPLGKLDPGRVKCGRRENTLICTKLKKKKKSRIQSWVHHRISFCLKEDTMKKISEHPNGWVMFTGYHGVSIIHTLFLLVAFLFIFFLTHPTN